MTPALEEAYLRVDVSCGSEACDTCRVGVSAAAAAAANGSAAEAAAAAAAAPIASLSAAAPFYLLPDDAALAEFLEMFELPDISNYVILASALKKVRAADASAGVMGPGVGGGGGFATSGDSGDGARFKCAGD